MPRAAPSGAGKSTLASLLTGVTTPQRGTVTLGGVTVGRVRTGTLPLLALIPQQAYVFTGTLRENLTYLQPAATDG
ncbi:MAG: ATP-binding cassette domain-containing protein [Pseudonocardiaceae bacterium]|nr:ATP-binding cassette domain-containing protein [Pseudonocardiaceae bacterium]